MKTLALRQKGQRRLGDKEEFLYTLEESPSSVDLLVESLRKYLSEEGKSIQQLLNGQDINQLKSDYEIIRRRLGINAGKGQEDVLGFIRVLLRNL